MASLIVVSSLFQFALAARLSLLRRIFTPVVAGTVIMLIAATVMPIVFDSLTDVPEGTSRAAAPVASAATLAVVAGLVLRAPPALRLWSPVIGIVVGCAVSAPFGLFDVQAILNAQWVGAPFRSWPGFDVTPGVEFWALLPAFVVVTLVGAIETIGDGVAIQRVSQRRPRATDFRVVQGALNADGVGNLLSGILGTLPNTTYSSSISLAEVTGIGARRVGIIIGAIFVVLAFFPKVAALLIAIPPPVVAAYITVLLGLLFVQGMKIIIQDGVDHRKAAVAGLAFWIGVGFQNQWIFPDLLGEGIPERAARERDDFRRSRRGHHDGVHGADRPTAQTSQCGIGRRGPAEVEQVPPGVRVESSVGLRFDGPSAPGGRGNPDQPIVG